MIPRTLKASVISRLVDDHERQIGLRDLKGGAKYLRLTKLLRLSLRKPFLGEITALSVSVLSLQGYESMINFLRVYQLEVDTNLLTSICSAIFLTSKFGKCFNG